MQNYEEIASSNTLQNSLAKILNNDKTSLSCSSGTSFPTANLHVGMLCYRTDQDKLYHLTVDTWKPVVPDQVEAFTLDGKEGKEYFSRIRALGSSENLNNITQTGRYEQVSDAAAATGTNYPSAVAGVLVVEADQSQISQQYTAYNGAHIFFRGFNTAWSPWREVWHSDNDGPGSGMDADKLDGNEASYFLPAASYNSTSILTKIKQVDGSGSGLDADFIDGMQASEFLTGSKSGDWELYSNNNSSTSYSAASLELREALKGASSSYKPPRLGFHWGGVAASQISINSSGTVEILNGAGTSPESLSANTITLSGDVLEMSDAKLKSDIEPIRDAMYKIDQLSGYTFTRKDLNNQRQTGVLAQEVREVLPEAVREDDNGTLAVSYGNLVGLLIEGIKHSNKEIESLQQEVRELKRLINAKL